MPETGFQQPNILFIMTDQQRFDAICALARLHRNPAIRNAIDQCGLYTPNFDRLAARGAAFTNAYSSCPVCVPARYTIRTGCDPITTGISVNTDKPQLEPDIPISTEERCGPYLARTMRKLGYRTFGVGKFHSFPWNEDLGYDVQFHSEELYGTPEQRNGDGYAGYITREHPQFDYIEGLMGERTEMYYSPQMSPLPAELGVEWWAADRAIELIQQQDSRPYFGFISFIGPHPPLAPPIPFNRIYNPEKMPNASLGELELDHMDPYLPLMNYTIWAEDISHSTIRILRARYFGEVSYIDHCLGRILDAVEARQDAQNTLIAFFTDHGDHLGDHHAWQKESFFEESCHIPWLLSWPKHIRSESICDALVMNEDLFGIATTAAGAQELRSGTDVLGLLAATSEPRETLFGCHGICGSDMFKIMVREGEWKYIYFANGGLAQLFNLADDPAECKQRLYDEPDVAKIMHAKAEAWLDRPNGSLALDANGLKVFPRNIPTPGRIYQFDVSRGVGGFPSHAKDILDNWEFKTENTAI